MSAVLDDPVVRGHVTKAIDALQAVRLRDYVPLFAHASRGNG